MVSGNSGGSQRVSLRFCFALSFRPCVAFVGRCSFKAFVPLSRNFFVVKRFADGEIYI